MNTELKGNIMSTPARTRFAPSPTGALHIGTSRTAVFAWLLARQTNGQFILRIEDTDQKREKAGSFQNIIDTLQWLGLNWDEGPNVGGSYGPYVQSERLAIYHKYAQQLIDKGLAYADPYSEAELNEFRELAKTQKRPFLYREHRPENPPTWDGTTPLRLKSTPQKYHWNDAVLGDLSAGEEAVDDFVIIKSDGFPTYNFAHIVDDYEMQITHVIRSQEFISSMPKFLNLYDALEIERPIFVTPPPVLNADGKKKLSKRDGARELLWFKEQGYLPETMINIMAIIGWNEGVDRELYTTDELIQKFDISRISRSGGRFDEKRLNWMSGQKIRALSDEQLVQLAQPYLPPEASKYDSDYQTKVIKLNQERLKFFAELPDLCRFFFVNPAIDDELVQLATKESKFTNEQMVSNLQAIMELLQDHDFAEESLQTDAYNYTVSHNLKAGNLFKLLRIAITGQTFSPGLFETMHLLGKDTVLHRLSSFLKLLN